MESHSDFSTGVTPMEYYPTSATGEIYKEQFNHDNLTVSSNASSGSSLSVNDALFDKRIRIIVLYVEIIVGTIGGGIAIIWLYMNRRRRSRINLLILHVTVSDLLVLFGACLPQLIWEYDRNWRAGIAPCKMLKLLQSFVMMASNNMLVVVGIDRHQAIRSPLREPIPVYKMTVVGYVLAFVLSVPQLFVYRIGFITDPRSRYFNMTLCESIWRYTPGRSVYLTYISIVVFYIPLISLIICYVRIFLKISEKVDEGRNRKHSSKPGKVVLTSTQSSSLPKAKLKTLKMTIVIATTFILCGFPYHILEMLYNFGHHESVSSTVASVLGGMAVANSSTNPYVFLLFNVNWKCSHPFSHIRRSYFDSSYTSSRSEYGDVSRTASTYAPGHVDMNKHKGALRYTVVNRNGGRPAKV